MRLFIIEAYGGKFTTDGAIHHFAVQADTAEQAIRLVRSSAQGQRFGRFEVVEIGEEIAAEEPAILSDEEGPYPRSL